MAEHNKVGQIGEQLAREYLQKQGYKIIEQNYRTRYAEIDLVAERKPGFFAKKELVFVEVRTKVGEQWGSPEDTLNREKLWKVRQNAQAYLAFKNWPGAAKIDAICIVLKPNLEVLRLTHHKNITA